jgi:hypothetical protein
VKRLENELIRLYTPAMNTLFVSALKVGIPLLRRYPRYHSLCGHWEAASLVGRMEDPNPMPGAGLTRISLPKKPWQRQLDVHSADVNSDGSHREHEGFMVPDRTLPNRFVRVVRYLDSAEVAHQLIEILSRDKLLVIPQEPGYHRHMLRRVKASLYLN